MADDFLSKLADKAEKTLKNPTNPYKVGKEKSRTIQVRVSLYNKIREQAFKQNRKIIDVVDDYIREGMSKEINHKS